MTSTLLIIRFFCFFYSQFCACCKSTVGLALLAFLWRCHCKLNRTYEQNTQWYFPFSSEWSTDRSMLRSHHLHIAPSSHRTIFGRNLNFVSILKKKWASDDIYLDSAHCSHDNSKQNEDNFKYQPFQIRV